MPGPFKFPLGLYEFWPNVRVGCPALWMKCAAAEQQLSQRISIWDYFQAAMELLPGQQGESGQHTDDVLLSQTISLCQILPNSQTIRNNS